MLMRRPSRMKYQLNKIAFYSLMLAVIANIVYILNSLEFYVVNNAISNFVFIDTAFNITILLLGFLTAVKLRMYIKKWVYVAYGIGIFQLVRIIWTPAVNNTDEFTFIVLCLTISSALAFLAGTISILRIRKIELIKEGKLDTPEQIANDKIDEIILKKARQAALAEKEALKREKKGLPPKPTERKFNGPIMQLRGINKIYPNNVQAVYDFNLVIEPHDFIVLVGPSGCGKSTTLRMVAGLESITTGDLLLEGKKINNLAPADRDIAMIFQDYALYGHMTVYDNIGFSLKIRHEDTVDIHDKVLDAGKIVKLEKELNRLPRNLSGGQRQRVALGRSIVRNAKIFLMDEPLSNLDAKLRGETRREIVKLYHELKATIIYVTHDQIEAMTMATKIVVMNKGYIQQIGTPSEVYSQPSNLFVASFMGSPAMNLFEGIISNGYFKTANFSFKLDDEQLELLRQYELKEVVLGIRPEAFTLDSISESNPWEVDVVIDYLEYYGASSSLRFEFNKTVYNAEIKERQELIVGQTVKLGVVKEKIHFFDAATTLRITAESKE